MLVFCIKQLLSLKRAILGRREPHQLAWGMALGVWLGVVPYGNLVALAILLFILSVRVNHGMVAVTAVLTSVIAAWFDAQTHAVGKYVLTHPQLTPQLSAAWQWPLVPWTDLNNTLVMGGLLVGLAAVVPIYLLSYPLFRYFAISHRQLLTHRASPLNLQQKSARRRPATRRWARMPCLRRSRKRLESPVPLKLLTD